ncbi:MAG TPA: hypothetical protein PLA02_04480 [Brevefilum fermentans]|jgi:hypothetical protein|uniref:Uncharacterized protein n=1 Tax=Candidatus Brevifilum fermentans TaxID=1986204 RepID=A0A1Y6K199_9CHLR|nr:hypothetical protein [Brevefilum fermentans]SMX53465.1 protein of unknown function [Brevefilum fermentans]HOM67267.1 hypothetical protein [Brevefilum fermentans]HQA28457.1 hypothetical protein [Brevefilum fermentans]
MNFTTILKDHLKRYPLMQAQDGYKLIHQAACGPAHAVTHREAAREWLKNELETLSDPWPEALIDPISPDGDLVRVHLAPFKAEGGDPEPLLDAFIRTSQEVIPDFQLLEEYLHTSLPFVPGLEELMSTLKPQGYPALHHSDAYRTAYRPAYRVVLKKYLLSHPEADN